MAFNIQNLDPSGSGSKGAGAFGIYSTGDNKATVLTDGYMDVAYRELRSTKGMMIETSDATFFCQVVANQTTGDVALTEFGGQFSSGLTAATDLGTVASQPASGSFALTFDRLGHGMFRVNGTLTAARISVTDAAGSGSFGALKLMDLVEGAWLSLGGRFNQTAAAEGAALTGAAGDAVYEIGLGFVAIAAAADGTLGATLDNVIGDLNVTNSGGTGSGTIIDSTGGNVDGTATAADLVLNWSGTAATIDANSTIDITGTFTCILVKLGDD